MVFIYFFLHLLPLIVLFQLDTWFKLMKTISVGVNYSSLYKTASNLYFIFKD